MHDDFVMYMFAITLSLSNLSRRVLPVGNVIILGVSLYRGIELGLERACDFFGKSP